MVKLSQTEILPLHSPQAFAAAVERAAALLQAGAVVAVPTETVYGLAANALDPRAVAAIYAVKGRPARNPIIVHVASETMARNCVADWPASAAALAHAFWPGPLTLVLPKARHIPDVVTAGGPTVGVRWPRHPFMQALIQRCGFPLAAPSANLSNRVSPTTAAHVRHHLEGRIPLIVDGGPCPVGIESTVVALEGPSFRVLRPGIIHEASLAAVLGVDSAPATGPEDAQAPLASPGQLPRHYAPRAQVLIWKWADETDLRARLAQLNARPEQTYVLAHACVPQQAGWLEVSVAPHDAEAYARALYAELHRADARQARWLAVEQPPDDAPWQAIHDRLRRAAQQEKT
jgi:L-threonylcarbamoyladenylate synthase